jgi:hypothetical protein
VLRHIQNALKEALLALPAEEYDWFDVHNGTPRRTKPRSGEQPLAEEPNAIVLGEGFSDAEVQRQTRRPMARNNSSSSPVRSLVLAFRPPQVFWLWAQ